MQKKLHQAVQAAILGSALAATSFAVADDQDQISGLTANLYGGYLYIDGELDQDPSTAGGLGLGYRFNSPWELELRHQVATDADFKYGPGGIDFTQTFLNAIYHFNRGKRVQPYALVGLGHQNMDPKSGNNNDVDSTLTTLGLGLKWALSDRWSARSDLSYINDLKFEHEHALATLGLHYQFGSTASKPAPKPVPVSTDDDSDGVPNQFDRCPGTGAGVTVDANGCEIVLDDDNDGVPNGRDKCANTSSGAKVDSNGCYIVITETKTVDLYVTFKTNSAELLAESLSEIDDVANFMAEYPLTQVLLEGHTDDRGSAAYNLNLSTKRARSVADYLIQRRGIVPSRVSSTGYGEARPAYPNDTKENLARNRRVTAKISAQVEQIKK